MNYTAPAETAERRLKKGRRPQRVVPKEAINFLLGGFVSALTALLGGFLFARALVKRFLYLYGYLYLYHFDAGRRHGIFGSAIDQIPERFVVFDFDKRMGISVSCF